MTMMTWSNIHVHDIVAVLVPYSNSVRVKLKDILLHVRQCDMVLQRWTNAHARTHDMNQKSNDVCQGPSGTLSHCIGGHRETYQRPFVKLSIEICSVRICKWPRGVSYDTYMYM